MIIILGTPGAGKTTQSRLLAQHLNCRWFSMGDLIRSSVSGKQRSEMLAGKIISDKTTLDLVDKALSTFDPKSEECIFEGNPRSLAQAKWWVAQAKAGRFKIKKVIHLVADLKVAENRMLRRGRLDDHDDDVVETRFNAYKASITPVLECFNKNGIPLKEISSNGTIEE